MDVVTRKDWGARRSKGTTYLSPMAVRFLAVHYTAMDADEQANHEKCAERVRGIQNFHMDTRGWQDIAYNWLVCKHGAIYRGRGWKVMSAATLGYNGVTVAVCFLGDDTEGRDDVTDAGRAAITEVWEFVKRNGPRVEGARPHSNFGSTACPGRQLAAFSFTLR